MIQQEMASSLEDLKKFDLLSNKFESFLEMMKQISGQVERDGSLADDGRRVIWRFASTDNHRGGASRFGDGAYPPSGAPPTAAPATTASSASLSPASRVPGGIRLEPRSSSVTSHFRGGHRQAQWAPAYARSSGVGRWDPQTPAVPGHGYAYRH